jgi:hypothetical protein
MSRPNYTDLRTYPFVPGDVIVLHDPDNPEQNVRYAVKAVEGSNIDRRILKLTVIAASDLTKYRLGSELDYEIDTLGNPVMGIVVTQSSTVGHKLLDAQGLNDLIVYESLQFMIEPFRNGRSVGITTVVKHLKERNVFGAGISMESAKRMLTAALNGRPKTFSVKGGWVSLLTVDMFPPSSKSDGQPQTVTNLSPIRLVNKDKLLQGILLVIESGVFGDIVWEREAV